MIDIQIENMGIAHKDDRRILKVIFNGDFVAKQIKVLEVKTESILGNHYHPYSELFYILKGGAIVNLQLPDTKEKKSLLLKEGDRLIIGARVAHQFLPSANTIMIEGTSEPYQGANKSDVKYQID